MADVSQPHRQELEPWLTAPSFVVMRKHGILEALTTDHHFEQAGFVPLVKP